MEENPKELRLKGGTRILDYIHRFSATEKAVFGIFVIAAIVTAFAMAISAADTFMIEVPARGGELREGIVGLPRTINPVLALTEADRDIAALVYAGLTRYDGSKLVGDLASSWKVSENGLTYDFKLRDGLHFHDGTALTAEDIAFTIQKIQDPALKSPRQADWLNVSVTAVSAKEVRFTLKQAYAPFLANTTLGIIPKHIWGSVSDDRFIFSEYNIRPVGAGAYKVDSITRDSGGIPTIYRLSAWNGYAGTEPYIARISLHFFSDTESAIAALDQAAIDSLSSVNPAEAKRLASNQAEPYVVRTGPLPRVFGLFFNQTQSTILADKTVRQALEMSVDRDAVINKVLEGYAVPIEGPVPFNTKDKDIAKPSVNTARTMLEKAGWRAGPEGFYIKKSAGNATTTLGFDIYTTDAPDLVATANLLKSQWAAIGVKVGIKTFEQNDLYQNFIRPRKYDALLFGEQIGKDRDLYAFWHSSQRNPPGLNVALYTNSKVDKALENLRTVEDDESRDNAYAELDGLIRADVPAIFLYSPDFIYVVPKALRGMELGTITIPSDRWSSVNSWYLETQKVWDFLVN